MTTATLATSSRLRQTALWRDALGMPEALQRTLAQREGFDAVLELLRAESVRRVVVTGNGAAYYVALAVATVSASANQETGPDWVAVPAGLILTGDFRFRNGDLPLVVSSSGELKDLLVALAAGRVPRPFALISGNPQSSLGQQAQAVARACVLEQTAVTHTQAYVANLSVALSLLAALGGRPELEQQLGQAPALCSAALQLAEPWAEPTAASHVATRAAVVAATGVGYPAALEAALLLKEVAGVVAEGLETREAATTGMYALGPGQLLLGLGLPSDQLLDETRRVCEARGAASLLVPGPELGSPALLGISSFPAALGLALGIGLERGLDVDRPAWSDAYYKTARK